jgi:hypothetical protein
LIVRSSKNYPNWDFWFENIPIIWQHRFELATKATEVSHLPNFVKFRVRQKMRVFDSLAIFELLPKFFYAEFPKSFLSIPVVVKHGGGTLLVQF